MGKRDADPIGSPSDPKRIWKPDDAEGSPDGAVELAKRRARL